MEKEQAPKPPLSGIIYGQFAYWLVLVGILVAIVGSIIYFASDGYVDKDVLLDNLWDGAEAEVIWEKAAGEAEIPSGHWYFGKLSEGDGIAMLGIAIASVAAAVGMWGAFVGMVRSRERMYMIFALIVAVILTLSAIGLVKTH